MLTLYSAPGSPGASTAAMHLAAHWASQGREVLLIEADPAGGSISHNLDIQFTPGTASFVASGQRMQSNHLIDHAQDVLFASLHVMPAPASPTGAQGIFSVLSDLAGELRRISENEMAVIIDGGRISPETAASGLTTAAAGVVAVCRDDSPLSNLRHLTDALAAGAGEAPAGCAVTVGESSMSAEEWQQTHGLSFSGPIAMLPDAPANLTTFLNRTKRRNKKWLASLEQLADALYVYAQPPSQSRAIRIPTAGADPAPAAQPAAAGQQPPTGAEPVTDGLLGDEPSVGGDTPPAPGAAPLPPAYHPPAPPAAPAGWASTEPDPPPQMHPSTEPPHGTPSHYPPPTGWDAYPPPTVESPQHPYPPPTVESPQHPYPPPTVESPQHPYPPPTVESPQHPYPPPTVESPQHPYPPPTVESPQHPYPPPTVESPQHPYPPPTVESPQQPHAPIAGQSPQHPYRPSSPGMAQPTPVAEEPPPERGIQPSGSFRDLAAKLHGLNAEGSAAQNRGV